MSYVTNIKQKAKEYYDTYLNFPRQLHKLDCILFNFKPTYYFTEPDPILIMNNHLKREVIL